RARSAAVGSVRTVPSSASTVRRFRPRRSLPNFLVTKKAHSRAHYKDDSVASNRPMAERFSLTRLGNFRNRRRFRFFGFCKNGNSNALVEVGQYTLMRGCWRPQIET